MNMIPPSVVWLHVISDALIVLACCAMPASLIYFVRKRRDSSFGAVSLCVALFIFACGLAHLMEIWNVWHSNYWLSGGIKALAAAAAVPAAILLVRRIPAAIALPGERAIEREIQTLRLATQAAGIGAFDWNVQSGRNTWTPELEAMYGLKPGEFGRTQPAWENLVHPEDRNSAMAIVHRAFETYAPQQGEWRVVWPDGSVRWIAGRFQVFKDKAGKPLRLTGVNLDVTERKKAEEQIRELNAELERRVIERTTQLESANKELEAFSYSVSHDLRAPLRAVDGFSQAVLEDFGPQLPEECQAHLRTIRGGAQRMGMLIDDLLSFSRLSRVSFHKQEVNTGDLVRSVLADLAPMRDGRQIDLRIGDLPECAGDPAMLKQVWVNLLSNAFKYTKKRELAVVEVGFEQQPEGKVYFVRDNGTGFDMRYADKLFGVFQRLHRAEEYEGTGVGLALVQRVILRHGGRVWAEAAVDSGATFFFTLEKPIQP